jgi:hypothetical protein
MQTVPSWQIISIRFHQILPQSVNKSVTTVHENTYQSCVFLWKVCSCYKGCHSGLWPHRGPQLDHEQVPATANSDRIATALYLWAILMKRLSQLLKYLLNLCYTLDSPLWFKLPKGKSSICSEDDMWDSILNETIQWKFYILSKKNAFNAFIGFPFMKSDGEHKTEIHAYHSWIHCSHHNHHLPEKSAFIIIIINHRNWHSSGTCPAVCRYDTQQYQNGSLLFLKTNIT